MICRKIFTDNAYHFHGSIVRCCNGEIIARSHHERWDGTGYPHRLKGDAIPLTARIFTVVDVWDALSSDRPYRPAWTKEAVITYVAGQAGKQFDSEVVEKFLQIIKGRHI